MVEAIHMKVNENLNRTGSELQEITNNFIYVDVANGKLLELFEYEWFISSLERLVGIVKRHYSDFKIYFAYPKGDERDPYFYTLPIAKISVGDESKGKKLEMDINRDINGDSKIPFILQLMEIEDDDEFKTLCAGTLFESDDGFFN